MGFMPSGLYQENSSRDSKSVIKKTEAGSPSYTQHEPLFLSPTTIVITCAIRCNLVPWKSLRKLKMAVAFMPQGKTPSLVVVLHAPYSTYRHHHRRRRHDHLMKLPAWKCGYINTFHLSINELIPFVWTLITNIHGGCSIVIVLLQTTLSQPPNERPYRNRHTILFPLIALHKIHRQSSL